MINESEPSPVATKLDFWLVFLRGLVGKCPRCGQGKLFASYLKPVSVCACCGEPLGHIRADDGPAWLTIVLVGHVMAPLLLEVVPYTGWADWLSMIVWPGLALVLALLILPRAKGIFIALIWRSGCVGAQVP